MNLYWICGHLKLVKIQQNSLLKFVDNFSASILTEFVYNFSAQNAYWICWHLKLLENSTWILTKFVYHFSAQIPYWICWHLKLLKIGHKSLLNLCTIFPQKSLLNLWASKIRHNSWLNFWTIFIWENFFLKSFIKTF